MVRLRHWVALHMLKIPDRISGREARTWLAVPANLGRLQDPRSGISSLHFPDLTSSLARDTQILSY